MTQPHPPAVDRPSPPPPPRGHELTRIWHDEATTASAQARRTDAARIAVDLLGDCSGTPAGIAARLVELAEPIAAWKPAVTREPSR